jgi:hypothetical protein
VRVFVRVFSRILAFGFYALGFSLRVRVRENRRSQSRIHAPVWDQIVGDGGKGQDLSFAFTPSSQLLAGDLLALQVQAVFVCVSCLCLCSLCRRCTWSRVCGHKSMSFSVVFRIPRLNPKP